MTAYNKSLLEKKPFAVVLNSKTFMEGKDNTLKIETSPGTDLKANNNEIKIDKEKNIWLLSYDRDKIKNVDLLISRNNIESRLNFSG